MNSSLHSFQIINGVVGYLYLSDNNKELRVASRSPHFYLFVLIRSFHRLLCKEGLTQNLDVHSTSAIHLQVLPSFDSITLFFDFCYYYMQYTEKVLA
jgi:hypothetical protein